MGRAVCVWGGVVWVWVTALASGSRFWGRDIAAQHLQIDALPPRAGHFPLGGGSPGPRGAGLGGGARGQRRLGDRRRQRRVAHVQARARWSRGWTQVL